MNEHVHVAVAVTLVFANMDSPLEIHEKYFVILYRMVRWQNMRLLKEMGVREHIPPFQLMQQFVPRRRQLRAFLATCNNAGGHLEPTV